MLESVTPGSLLGKQTCRSLSCCLVVLLSVCLSAWVADLQASGLASCVSVCLSVCQEENLQITVLPLMRLSVWRSVCLYVGEADLQVTVLPLVCLSVCLSVCRSVYRVSRPAAHCLASCVSDIWFCLFVCLSARDADLQVIVLPLVCLIINLLVAESCRLTHLHV